MLQLARLRVLVHTLGEHLVPCVGHSSRGLAVCIVMDILAGTDYELIWTENHAVFVPQN